MCNAVNLFLDLFKPKPKEDPPKEDIRRKVSQCFYCGFAGSKVEAGGVYHCPQPFCQGPGNFHARWKAGYHDEKGSMDEQQAARMLADCERAISVEKDNVMRLAMQASLAQLMGFKTTDQKAGE